MIQAIETWYNGTLFRSRTEARWAIFFDYFRQPWQYEKEGYWLNGEQYLPDFWLPTRNLWLEIKGSEPNQRELRVADALCLHTGRDVIIWQGDPADDNDTTYYTFQPFNSHDEFPEVCPACERDAVLTSNNPYCACGFLFAEYQHGGECYEEYDYAAKDRICDDPRWSFAAAYARRHRFH